MCIITFADRDVPNIANRNWKERAFTVGIGGPVGSGKTALLLTLCQRLRSIYNIGVVTNDIFTREDQEFLIRNSALIPTDRIKAIETGSCPLNFFLISYVDPLLLLELLPVIIIPAFLRSSLLRPWTHNGISGRRRTLPRAHIG